MTRERQSDTAELQEAARLLHMFARGYSRVSAWLDRNGHLLTLPVAGCLCAACVRAAREDRA